MTQMKLFRILARYRLDLNSMMEFTDLTSILTKFFKSHL